MLANIGDKLRTARDNAGLTQAQVETCLGINKAQLSYYENGKREISISILEKLASLYGYEINYFLSDSEIVEPDVQIAFRGAEVCDEDLQVITWAKTFLNNLCEMNELKRV